MQALRTDIFLSIFARKASAVTPSEKNLTLMEVHYAFSNEPKINIVRIRCF